ncbi:hypothetical protein N0V95_007278 [Ascochyta clinopodiicola]|nr:hypothetical protein N0V95_007278 [Ascochyta clinopodiicola]
MPLWIFYHPSDTFTDQAEKQDLVDKITWIYHGLPRHWVDILFIPVEATSYFCGNETRRDLWKVNGLVPPMPNSKAEKGWVKTNVPKPFKLEDGGLTEVQPFGFSAQI